MNISTSTIQQRRRKPTQNIVEEEDASQLKLGPEFDIKQITHEGLETPLITLNLSEARLLINATLKQRRKQASGVGVAGFEGGDELENNDDEEEDFANSNEVLRKTQEYLSIFARFRSEQTVSAVEHLLKSSDNADLHPFEIAQLGSLTCDEAEEAKTLIASLANKKSDEELQILLDHVSI
jgi:DNA-directed RNA polymerase II subunit RPB4